MRQETFGLVLRGEDGAEPEDEAFDLDHTHKQPRVRSSNTQKQPGIDKRNQVVVLGI